MKIGLVDVDNLGKFPNLPLMKISAYHKAKGDSVEFANVFDHYDRIYSSKVFNREYFKEAFYVYNTDEMVFGGTGYAISVKNGIEVYNKGKDWDLPYEMEHMYPDYSLYPSLTKGKAFGFLTRGCPNCCPFCIVSKKEGVESKKVADLIEWWDGQKEIVLMDANILACKDREDLLMQLAKSNASVDYTQGLDARHITKDVAELLKQIKTKTFHFAFDLMKNEQAILNGLKIVREVINPDPRRSIVYILTNYNTTFEEDIYRIRKVQELGFRPDVRVYRKGTEPKITKWMARWSNNRFVYNSAPDFMDYMPRKDGKTMKQILEEGIDENHQS